MHGLSEQTYDISVSKKDPSRVFIGHSDGVGSMRWNGQLWIDEGRLPKVVYGARSVVEDSKRTLWASGGDNQIVRIDVAPSGMRDSKAEMLGVKRGLPEGPAVVNFVAGSIFATVDRVNQEFRWDEAAHKFVVDNRFCCLSMRQILRMVCMETVIARFGLPPFHQMSGARAYLRGSAMGVGISTKTHTAA